MVVNILTRSILSQFSLVINLIKTLLMHICIMHPIFALAACLYSLFFLASFPQWSEEKRRWEIGDIPLHSTLPLRKEGRKKIYPG